MALARLNDFAPGTTILSGSVDSEFDQLVKALNGVDTIEILHKFSHATTPVVNINQLNTGVGALLVKGQQNSSDTFKVKANGFIVGYAKNISTRFDQVGNVGAGPDDLHSITINANTLAANNDLLVAHQGGNFTANNNDKKLIGKFGGQTFFDTSLLDIDGAVGWNTFYRIVRMTATTARVSGIMIINFKAIDSGNALDGFANSFLGYSFNTVSGITVSDMGSNNLILLIQGDATADNDVFQNFSCIDAIQNS